MPPNRHHIERSRSGFSLIEVLVAAAVFSLGLTGVSLMLMVSVHGTAEARNHTAAAMHASSLAELILLNPAALGHYIHPATPGGDCFVPQGCSAAEWAAGNLARWQHELQQSLAHAKGVVCRDGTPNDGSVEDFACDGAGQAVVKVLWDETGMAGSEPTGGRRVAVQIAR